MDEGLVYAKRADQAREHVQWNQGEDRWMCTLLIQGGWRIEYVAISNQLTNAPMELQELFDQRRRWVPSTLYNTWDVISSFKTTTEKHKK